MVARAEESSEVGSEVSMASFASMNAPNAPSGNGATWREEFRASGHPLAQCLDHFVALHSVLEARPAEGVRYLFSNSTLGFLRAAADFAMEVPGGFEDGVRRVIDLDAALLELKVRLSEGRRGSYAFGQVLEPSYFGNGWGRAESPDRSKGDPSETALDSCVVEALALAAWIAPDTAGKTAPVRLDDFVFGLLAVAGEKASTLGRVLGETPGVTQAAALRSEIQSRLSELANAIGRVRAQNFASIAPAGWPALPTAEDTPDYRPDRPIDDLGHDLLGFGEDARAIAELLCLREAGARAVGVFGAWGSGKSSLLNLTEKQIDALLLQKRPMADPGQARPDPFIERVEHIRFNVWHYNDSELMLALADVTLKHLRRFRVVDRLREQLGTNREGWKSEKAQGESEIAAAETRRQDALARVTKADETAKATRAKASTAARVELAGLLRQGGVDGQAMTELLELAESSKSLYSTFSLSKLRFLLAANAGYWFAALALAAIFAFAAWLAVDEAGGLAAIIAGIVGFVAPFAKFLTAINGALTGYARVVDDAERVHADEVAAAQHESESALDDIAAHMRKVQAAFAKIETYDGDGVAPLWRYLLHDSLEAREIEQARGVTSRVQDVFGSINQLISDQFETTAPVTNALPDRVIFYIDELDRCRAAQVVRMLEAIHLLLAFDNFAVIVAVDSRWLEASLRSVFRDELARTQNGIESDPGEITVHEYIEKIIQLPIRVRPLAFEVNADREPSGSVVALIGHLTAGAAEAAEEEESQIVPELDDAVVKIEPLRVAPDRFLPRDTLRAAAERATLTEAEIAGLRRMGIFVRRSPRTVKRFVNVYRLVRALQTGDALARFRDESYAPAQLCLAIQCGMDSADVARFAAWLTEGTQGDQASLEILLKALGPADAKTGAARIAEQIGDTEARAALMRWWAETMRFTFWNGPVAASALSKSRS